MLASCLSLHVPAPVFVCQLQKFVVPLRGNTAVISHEDYHPVFSNIQVCPVRGNLEGGETSGWRYNVHVEDVYMYVDR